MEKIKELSLNLQDKLEALKSLSHEDDYVILSPQYYLSVDTREKNNGNGGYASSFKFGQIEKIDIVLNFERCMELREIKSGSDVVKKSYVKDMFKIKWWDDEYWIDEENAKYHGHCETTRFEGKPISSRIDFCKGFEEYHKNGVFMKEFEEIEEILSNLSKEYTLYLEGKKKKEIIPFITELRSQRWYDSKQEFSKNTKHDSWLLSSFVDVNKESSGVFSGDWNEVTPNVFESKKYFTDRYMIIPGFFGYRNICKQTQMA
jgi:hypothetical protein